MWLKEKGERGQGGSETWRWVNRRWVEDWIWGVSASDLQNLVWEEKGRKECSYFSTKNCQQRVDWFSHMPPLHVFCHLFCLDFSKILNLEDCFVSEGATQDSSLSPRVSDTEVCWFIWSVSQPGSEECLHLYCLAQSLSVFGQILYPPARRGWQTTICVSPSFFSSWDRVPELSSQVQTLQVGKRDIGDMIIQWLRSGFGAARIWTWTTTLPLNV